MQKSQRQVAATGYSPSTSPETPGKPYPEKPYNTSGHLALKEADPLRSSKRRLAPDPPILPADYAISLRYVPTSPSSSSLATSWNPDSVAIL